MDGKLMKFKLIILSLMLPLSAMGATNAFDNVLIKNNFVFTGGTPGAGKILTSDASGNYLPQTPTYGDVFAASNNVFTGFNRFNNTTLFVGAITNTSGASVIGDSGSLVINFATGKSTWLGQNAFEFDARRIRDSSNRITVDAENTTLRYPATSSTSIQWVNATLHNSNGVATVNYHNRFLFGTWSNTGPAFFVATNIDMNSFSRIAGMLNTEIITNITSASLTVTGQGTHTINVEGGASGAFAVTNANNFFTSASANTFNGTQTFSNTIYRGGMVLNRKAVANNYTNTSEDYYLSYMNVTSGQPTNFLNTGFPNGQTFIIKDGARAASTTNIILKPLSTDTIMGVPSYFININGQSITVTYDGTSNWEIN